MKTVLCLAALIATATWADEAADRMSIAAALTALNASPSQAKLFTAGFANTRELLSFLAEAAPIAIRVPAEGSAIQTQAGTLVISHEPMGEATFYPVPTAPIARFTARSIAFVSPDSAIVVAVHERLFGSVAARPVAVLFVLKREGSDWRFASFRALPEAR